MGMRPYTVVRANQSNRNKGRYVIIHRSNPLQSIKYFHTLAAAQNECRKMNTYQVIKPKLQVDEIFKFED